MLRVDLEALHIINVIPKGIDKFMSIIVNRHIIFIDSLQFYNGSHDALASNLNS